MKSYFHSMLLSYSSASFCNKKPQKRCLISNSSPLHYWNPFNKTVPPLLHQNCFCGSHHSVMCALLNPMFNSQCSFSLTSQWYLTIDSSASLGHCLCCLPRLHTFLVSDLTGHTFSISFSNSILEWSRAQSVGLMSSLSAPNFFMSSFSLKDHHVLPAAANHYVILGKIQKALGNIRIH